MKHQAGGVREREREREREKVLFTGTIRLTPGASVCPLHTHSALYNRVTCGATPRVAGCYRAVLCSS